MSKALKRDASNIGSYYVISKEGIEYIVDVAVTMFIMTCLTCVMLIICMP